MAQILVRNLSEETVTRLKQQAKRNNRSLEAEVRLIVEEATAEKPDLVAFAELARKIREANGPQTTDSVDLIREDRDSR